jgi:haloacetate dehalogenase
MREKSDRPETGERHVRDIRRATRRKWSSEEKIRIVLNVWRPWTTNLQGMGLDCGHHMAEEAPEVLAAEILAFTRGGVR